MVTRIEDPAPIGPEKAANAAMNTYLGVDAALGDYDTVVGVFYLPVGVMPGRGAHLVVYFVGAAIAANGASFA
jgi:hypothetical protein